MGRPNSVKKIIKGVGEPTIPLACVEKEEMTCDWMVENKRGTYTCKRRKKTQKRKKKKKLTPQRKKKKKTHLSLAEKGLRGIGRGVFPSKRVGGWWANMKRAVTIKKELFARMRIRNCEEYKSS